MSESVSWLRSCVCGEGGAYLAAQLLGEVEGRLAVFYLIFLFQFWLLFSFLVCMRTSMGMRVSE